MYDDNNWFAVTGDELTGFLDQIDKIGGKYATNPQTTQVAWRQLPFYDSVVLVRVVDPSWGNKKLKIYYLTEQGRLYRLNGTSPPIHEVNGKVPPKLNEGNVLEYLRFFCFFVRGEEGPFLIMEDAKNPDIPQEKLDDNTKSIIENVIRPASFEGMNDQGHYLCDAIVFYSNALFLANFAVQPGGMIEMLDDEPLAPGLPVRVEAPVD